MDKHAIEVVLASDNRGKLAEISAGFAGLPIRLRPQSDFELSSADETATTFVENALLKARHAATQTGLAALADDSGLVVPHLGGAPGIYSARYAGLGASDEDNIAKLLAALDGVEQRAAKFVCVMTYLRHADDPLPLIATGEWVGEILSAPQGAQGFGYDPVFYLPSHQCSAAELDRATKNRLSHRGCAMQYLVRALRAEHRVA